MFTTADLPPLMFRIETSADPLQSGTVAIEVPILIDLSTNAPVIGPRGKALRYFSFLPRWISRLVSSALLEFWFRIDYRLEMNDIVDRIEPGVNGLPNLNAVSMRRQRLRHNLKLLAWSNNRTWPTKGMVVDVGRYTSIQICLNTTMDVDATNNRFLQPAFSDEACSANGIRGYVPAIVPTNHFLTNEIGPIPSRRMLAAIILRRRCQTLAMTLGIANTRDCYLLLSDEDAPTWWTKGSGGEEGRSIVELDGISHSEFMRRVFG